MKKRVILQRTLSLLPSVGVFTEETNELVSYEFLDVIGAITAQFTRLPHRRKGLGSAVEWKICAETWKRVGLIPYKAVSHNRPRVLKLSDNSPLWTQKLDESGSPRRAKFFMYHKQDMPKFEFYEN
uniref:Glycine N-acyltransferase-like protein n=1 Tax=Bursaphelenchus xylophilus TaxID=6326 RepID=A0A1I7SBK9_BURXY